MVADLHEVTVKGRALLLSVNGIFSGIYIDDEPPFVSAPKEGVGGSADCIFEGFQTLACCENLVFESAQRGLAGSVLMLFSQGQPERLISTLSLTCPRPEAIIAILIACRNLIDSLTKQLEHRMIRMPRRSWTIKQRLYTAKASRDRPMRTIDPSGDAFRARSLSG
jgi:hypothetical protein